MGDHTFICNKVYDYSVLFDFKRERKSIGKEMKESKQGMKKTNEIL